MKFFKNSRGMTLVQTLVAAAISSIIMFALFTTLYNSMMLGKAAELRTQINDTVTLAKMQLSSSKVCSERFMPHLSVKKFSTTGALPEISATQIGDADGNGDLIKVNDKLSSIPGTNVTGILVTGLRDASSFFSPGSRYVGKIDITVAKPGIGGTDIKRSIPISLITSFDSVAKEATVVSCAAMNSDITEIEMEIIKAEVCGSLGGQWIDRQCKNIRNTASPNSPAPPPTSQCNASVVTATCVYMGNGTTTNYPFNLGSGSAGQVVSGTTTHNASAIGMFSCGSDGRWYAVSCMIPDYGDGGPSI
jgi:hypothetical protein